MLASSTLPASPSLVPLMRYRDVSAAIDWLCSALGFEKQVAVSDPDGVVYYAQLTYGNSMIMLGSVRDSELDKLMCQPDEVGGVETQSCYLIVEDADAHYARATAAGAEIVLDIKSDGLGRRGYSCKDPEGHIWNFGTYNPCKIASVPATIPVLEAKPRRRLAAVAVLAMFVTAALGAAWWATGVDLLQYAGLAPPAPQQAARPAPAKLTVSDEALRQNLAAMKAAKEQAELAAEAARKDLADAQAGRTEADAAAKAAQSSIEAERSAKEAALRMISDLETKLTAERTAKDAAGRTATDAMLALEKERMAREALERTKRNIKKSELESQSSSENTASPSPIGSGEGAPIETSATQPASTEAAPPESSTWTVASEGPAKPEKAEASTATRHRAVRRRTNQARAPVVPRFKPTYITDLHDVPWPYSVWYRRR